MHMGKILLVFSFALLVFSFAKSILWTLAQRLFRIFLKFAVAALVTECLPHGQSESRLHVLSCYLDNMETTPKPQIRTIDIGTLLNEKGEANHLGHEVTVFDDITWKDLVGTPTQIGFLLIAFCTEGEARFTMNEKSQRMEAGDLLISFGEQIFKEEYVSEHFHAKAVLMSRPFAQNCIVGMNHMWPFLLYLIEHPVLKMTEEEQEWLLECHRLIRRHLVKATGKFMREATASLVRAFYFEICGLLDLRVQPGHTDQHNRAYALFDQFIRLVSEHFKQERSVEWYSSEMCITPKHLSEAVKRVSGKTAGQWISTLVIIEIKSLLKNTSLSMKEIADEMNFCSQSFMGKYFKNIEGISPSAYRRN